MAELADAHGSGPCARKGMEVRVLLPAPQTKDSFLPVFCLLLIPRGLEPTRVRVGLRIFFSSLAEQKMRQRSDQRERRSHRRWRCDFCAAKYFHFALPQCKTRQRSDSQERRSHRRWRCLRHRPVYFCFHEDSSRPERKHWNVEISVLFHSDRWLNQSNPGYYSRNYPRNTICPPGDSHIASFTSLSGERRSLF